MAGLTAALKLASGGKKVLILEKQPVPGGVGTSFKRKGFTFESSLHYVDALGPEGEVREFLDKQGVSRKIEYIDLKEFGRVMYPEHDFVQDNDFGHFKEWLKNNFPGDSDGIDEFFRAINKFYRQLDHYIYSEIPLWLKHLALPILYPAIIWTSCISLEQFISKKIKDKKARAIIGTIWGFIGLAPSEVSAFYYLIVLQGCWGKKTAYIRGGFSSLFAAMTERMKELGSEVVFNTSVTGIITENGKLVKAVRTDKGEEFRAKTVISNANAIDTLTRFIDNPELKQEYAGKLSLMRKSVSALTVYLGLDVPAKDVGMNSHLLSISSTYDHEQGLKSCLKGDFAKSDFAVVDHSQLDASRAPSGKSSLCVMTFADYASWSGLTREDYEKKKKEAGNAIVENLERYLPGLSGHVEFMEVATPMTMERYASLPEGAVYGFAETVPQSSINRFPQKTKIKGLFLAGAWTRPGCGVHGCFVSGSEAADMVMKVLR
jgi:prolycopene isomerase